MQSSFDMVIFLPGVTLRLQKWIYLQSGSALPFLGSMTCAVEPERVLQALLAAVPRGAPTAPRVWELLPALCRYRRWHKKKRQQRANTRRASSGLDALFELSHGVGKE